MIQSSWSTREYQQKSANCEAMMNRFALLFGTRNEVHIANQNIKDVLVGIERADESVK